MTMLTSTRKCQDEATGISYMDMVAASMGLVSLGTPLMAVDCQMPTLEVITNMDMADVCPKLSCF